MSSADIDALSLRLVRPFFRIDSAELQHQIIRLVEAAAAGQPITIPDLSVSSDNAKPNPQ